MNVANLLWDFLNSSIGLLIVASLVLFIVNTRWAKPYWTKFQGAIETGVRLAEKVIPDDTENKGLARLDEALKYVVSVFEEVNHRQPTAKERANLKEGVQITHADLHDSGALTSASRK